MNFYAFRAFLDDFEIFNYSAPDIEGDQDIYKTSPKRVTVIKQDDALKIFEANCSAGNTTGRLHLILNVNFANRAYQ